MLGKKSSVSTLKETLHMKGVSIGDRLERHFYVLSDVAFGTLICVCVPHELSLRQTS